MSNGLAWAAAGAALTFGLMVMVPSPAFAQEPGLVRGTDKPTDKADAAATNPDKDKDKPKVEHKIETATFGGGCFWCLEAVFERLKGVKDVRSGYAGGDESLGKPTYEAVCTGMTGHAEVVQIDFDTAEISYSDLLDVFWLCHDPTTLNAQGPDHGTQYRSVILYSSDAQKQAAQKSYEKATAEHLYPTPIVTQLVPLHKFYVAEKYHQNYYNNNRAAGYCQMVISPKLRDLQVKLAKKAKLEESAAKAH